MRSSSDARLLAVLVAVLLAMAAAVAGGVARAHDAGAGASISPQAGAGADGVGGPVSPPSARPAALAARLDSAQTAIEHPGSSGSALEAAGLAQELSVGVLEGDTASRRRETLSLLSPRAAATARADLSAAGGLSRITTPETHFPPWRIVEPPAPDVLLSYYRAAQARFGIPWQYLAAIEFVETKFGRIHGPSPAGAQGPMQFEPATWASYGRGSIDSQRDSIFAAARYLAANGAPREMADALLHYNNSADYVNAVTEYARRMQADPRAFDGYYGWQVIFEKGRGKFVLPDGFPAARPEPVRSDG